MVSYLGSFRSEAALKIFSDQGAMDADGDAVEVGQVEKVGSAVFSPTDVELVVVSAF
jgi:hypothetical protein